MAKIAKKTVKKKGPDKDEKMVIKHIAKDDKEFRGQIKDDQKLKKKLLKDK